MNLIEILKHKRQEVHLNLNDVFAESDDPNWKLNHPVGPVHVQIKCKLCGEVIKTDLKEYGWLHNPSFVEKYLQPHINKHK